MLTRRWLLAGIAAIAVTPARAEAWQRYRNARFGTSIEYPVRFRPGRAPTNGDGLGFASADGASFSVWGGHNALDHDVQGLKRFVRDNLPDGAKVVYAARGANWFAISGVTGDSLFYERHLLSHGGQIVNGFVMHYPSALKAPYDAVVARMAKRSGPAAAKTRKGLPRRPRYPLSMPVGGGMRHLRFRAGIFPI